MKILICGGAGYIGSHMLKQLHRAGHETITFDNLSEGYADAVRWGGLVQGDLLDENSLESVFQAHSFDAVMHFSALIVVPHSVENPARYYQNNVVGTLNLLEAMRRHGVDRFIFSSTAAVYGDPTYMPMDEAHPIGPLNPYGHSKWMVEQLLADYALAYGLRSISFRYFNAAGADPDGEIGERHQPETHLIPNLLLAQLDGTAEMEIFGNDYDTVDGTCVRDYVHVNDIAQAHLKGLSYLEDQDGAHCFNLGSGDGFSNLQVVEAVAEVTGRPVDYRFGPRRLGDAPILVADSRRVREALSWQPVYVDLKDIVETAWRWHQGLWSRTSDGV